MKKAFTNWRAGGVHLNPPNGNHISTTWAPCSYSDNYDRDFEEFDSVHGRISPPIESGVVEVTIDCGDKLLKRLQNKFNEGQEQPFGRLSFDEWLYIVNKVTNEKK